MRKQIICWVAALVAVLTAMNTSAVPMSFNGHWYEVIRAGGITWADAEAAASASILAVGDAQLDGTKGYLATATDAAENAFIDSLRVAASLGQVWLGGRQPDGEMVANANWFWITGEDWNCFINWGGGEPNDNYGAGSEQHLGIGLFGNDTWNDEGALGNIQGYVIEWGPNRHCVPEGGSLALVSLLSMSGLLAAHRKMGRR